MNKPSHQHPTHDAPVRIPVAVAAPHVQLTQAVIEELFCDNYRLHELSKLVQPTQYAALESVTLIGPRGRLSNVRVIGSPRSVDQVELSQTDAPRLGIDAPVRGVAGALRHIHMTPSDADRLGLKDRNRVEVAHERRHGQVLFRDVLVRVSSRLSVGTAFGRRRRHRLFASVNDTYSYRYACT